MLERNYELGITLDKHNLLDHKLQCNHYRGKVLIAALVAINSGSLQNTTLALHNILTHFTANDRIMSFVHLVLRRVLYTLKKKGRPLSQSVPIKCWYYALLSLSRPHTTTRLRVRYSVFSPGQPVPGGSRKITTYAPIFEIKNWGAMPAASSS